MHVIGVYLGKVSSLRQGMVSILACLYSTLSGEAFSAEKIAHKGAGV